VNQFVTHSLAEYRQVELGHGIGGQHVDQFAGGHGGNRLTRSPDRLRAVQPPTIEFLNAFVTSAHV